MQWIAWRIISTLINTFIIINIVDVILMGPVILKYSNKSKKPSFVISKENRIDIQEGNSCSGYSISYVLRHYGIPADGDKIYAELPKRKNGYVYQREVKRMLEKYGFKVKYRAGNLHTLRNEVSRGNPVIVYVKVRKDKNWRHFVPVVGYDENNIFLAESLAEFVNCNENLYNRKISNEDFKMLWNTSTFVMPLYTHTFFSIDRKGNGKDEDYTLDFAKQRRF